MVLDAAERGDYGTVMQEFHRAYTKTNPLRTNMLRSWLDAIFASPTALTNLDPKTCALMIRECGFAVSRSDGALDDTWLAQKFTQFGTDNATATHVLLDNWSSEIRESEALAAWLVQSFDLATLNNRDAGLAARLFNMLWNGGHYQYVSDLCVAGVDSLQAAYDTTAHAGAPPEGLHSGYIQPLQHMLGSYVAPVEDPTMEATLHPDQKDRLDGARAVLATLGKLAQTHPDGVKILTSFAEVRGSNAVAAFRRDPGMIWGFENVRKSLVQAVHLTPEGQRPVRMMEIWGAIRPALNQAVFAALMQHPDTEILRLASTGLQDMANHLQRHPEDFALLNLPEFAPKFLADAMSYLDFMSKRAPDFKHRTARERGHVMSAYEAAYGCKLGLWWAESLKQPVYYCVDGLRMEDATGYKARKTAEINSFLQGNPDSRAFSEVITLAELRVILKDWTRFSKIVHFVEKGEVLAPNDPKITTWIRAMEQSDADADERLAPALHTTAKELDFLLEPGTVNAIMRNLPAHQVAADDAVKAIADQLYFVWLAAVAKHEVLSETLAKATALFDAGILPRGLDVEYQSMINDQNPVSRQGRATTIKNGLHAVDPRLREVLSNAVDRFTPPASTPPRNQVV